MNDAQPSDRNDTPEPASNQNASSQINPPEFNEAGKNTVKPIANGSQAYAIARRLWREDLDKRDNRRARILSAFNGNPPYSDTEMKAKGQSYRFNVSFGFLEGLIGRAMSPYIDLIGDPRTVMSLKSELPTWKIQIIEDAFGDIVADWGKWHKHVTRTMQEMLLYGYCTNLFPSDYSPWPIFVEQKDGWVAEYTANDVTDVEVYVWRKFYMIHELFMMVEDKKTAEKAGWNVDNVHLALEQAKPFRPENFRSEQSMQDIIRSGTLYASVLGATKVEAYHVFVRELDGSATHWILCGNMQGGNSDDKTSFELFKRESRFKTFGEFLVYFDMEAGNGKWHGSRGIGQRGFNIHRAQDKLRNSILSQATASGLTIIQTGNQSEQIDMNLAVIGPFCAIPAGITVSAQQFPPVSSNLFSADQLLTAASSQRIGDVVPEAQGVQGTQKTAAQAKIDASREMVVSKLNLRRVVDPISKMLGIMLARLSNPASPNPFAKAFQERLATRGVTPDDLKMVKSVGIATTIADVFGEGAEAMKAIFAEFRGDPDINQTLLKRKRIASLSSTKDADELIINPQDKTQVIEAVQKQQTETGTILDGLEVPVSPRDNHEIEGQACVQWMQNAIQALNAGQGKNTPVMVTAVMKHCIGHAAGLLANKATAKKGQQLQNVLRQLNVALTEYEKKANQMMHESAVNAAKGMISPKQQPAAGPGASPTPNAAVTPAAMPPPVA